MTEAQQTEAMVRALLWEAGIVASTEEIARLTASYAGFRAGVGMLYAVAEARYESPAVRFNAQPTFADWS